MPTTPEPQRFTVEASEDGQRLDLVLARRIETLSRRRAAALASAGQVRVNGRRAAKGRALRPGEVVELRGGVGGALAPAEDALEERRLLLVQPDLIVVDKPAGVPTQPLSAAETGSVLQRLAVRFPEVLSAGPDPLDGGLLHRLDVETSGTLAVARDRASHDRLRPAFAEGLVEKAYLALVSCPAQDDALVAAAEISFPIARARSRGGQMVAVISGEERIRGSAMAATTRYRLLARGADCAALEVWIRRGRMHQIRVHLAAMGHPIIGDTRYGVAAPDLGRHALHASSISLESVGGPARVSAPLPADLIQLCTDRGIEPSILDPMIDDR